MNMESLVVKLIPVSLVVSAGITVGYLAWLDRIRSFWMALTIPLVAIALAIAAWRAIYLTRLTYKGHKKVSIVIRRETAHQLSTHLGGNAENIIFQLARRITGRLPHGIKLFSDPEDRQALNDRALEVFEGLLDEYSCKPNTVLVSCSRLNDVQRNHFRVISRLEARAQAVKRRPQWQYQECVRTLGLLQSLCGRWLFAWEVMPGETYWQVKAPGVVVWRRDDPVPVLGKDFKLLD